MVVRLQVAVVVLVQVVVRSVPFTFIVVAPETKLVPVTVSSEAAEPVAKEMGEMEVNVGAEMVRT